MLLNPYVCGQPVSSDQFFGREEELRVLTGRIVESVHPQPCAVIGETWIGRTSLLRHFTKNIASMRPDLVIRSYNVSDEFKKTGNTIEFYRRFITMIAEDLDEYEFAHEEARKAADESIPMGPLMKLIKRYFRSIRDAGYWLLLVLDGFDYTTELFAFDPMGWRLLRELGSNQDYGLCYLLASRTPLEQLERDANLSSSRFAGIFTTGTIRLALMPEHEAGMLVDLPMKRLGLHWPPLQRELALHVGGGHPALLQMTCFYLFQRYVAGTLEAVRNEDQLIRALQEQYKHFLTWQRERLEEAKLFHILLSLAHGVPVDASERQIDELVSLGHLLRTEGKYDRFRPISPVQDFYLHAYGRQVTLWPKVEETEDVLQYLVESRYQDALGQDWLDEVRRCTTETGDAMDMVSRWEATRERENSNPFATLNTRNRLIQYASIADLKELIKQHSEMFQDAFPRTKFQQAEQALNVLQAARSPEAHYRRISNNEATYVEDCCRELLAALGPALQHPVNGSSEIIRLPQVDDVVDNKYVIEAFLQSTNHSQVARAWDKNLNRAVAIKFLLLDARLNREQRVASHRLLGREGQIIAKLMNRTHYNIGIVLAALPEYPAIVTLWLESKEPSFEEMVLNPALQMPLPRILSIGIQLADALAYLQEQGIVHRDIKPSNILLNEAGDPVLIDFHVARALNFDTITSTISGYVGSPAYSAPEQFEQPDSVSSPADIFALGVVLYQALTHELPYPDGNEPALYTTDQLPEPERRTIPERLYEILRAMLSQWPNKRPKARVLRDQLQAYLSSLETGRTK